jgi:hypothetical protein
MIKSRLEIMEDVHNGLVGAVIHTQCEIEMLEPKTIIITDPKQSMEIKFLINGKKHGIEMMEETIAILEDKIDAEKKIISEKKNK